jgi:hypothetical protein
MALYELRTYTLRVGAMAEAVKLYQEIGFPAARATAAVHTDMALKCCSVIVKPMT